MRRKEPSNFKESPKRRFTLPKSHILRGRRNFEELFSNSALIKAKNINLHYSIKSGDDRKLLVGFIAPKKIGNAVARVQTKRILREAYRLNQDIISDLPQISNLGLHYAFMAKHANLTFDSAQEDVVLLLTKLREQVLSKNSLL